MTCPLTGRPYEWRKHLGWRIGMAKPMTGLGYDDFEPNRLKHMEMIQAVVARLGGNGFLVKGWAITVAAALSGFSLNSDEAWLAVGGLASTLFFWSIDAYFLRAERLFRALFEEVRNRDKDISPFFMGATGKGFVDRVRSGKTRSPKEVARKVRTAFRPTLFLFYSALVVTTAIVAWMTRGAP
jgi:hypothetical protein